MLGSGCGSRWWSSWLAASVAPLWAAWWALGSGCGSGPVNSGLTLWVGALLCALLGAVLGAPIGVMLSAPLGSARHSARRAGRSGAPFGARLSGSLRRRSARRPALCGAPLGVMPALVAQLRVGDSKYALRPSDPHLLTSMAAAVSGAVDAGVPVRSLRCDNRQWAEWALFCEETIGTGVLRPDCASIAHDADALAREQFLLAAFVIWRYGRMLPRRNAPPQAKPPSVRPYVDTVRNVHTRRGITLAGAPVVSRVIKGLLKPYVRVHGTDALIPTRKEPITNGHCAAIY